jgi:hypothetical protein
VLVVLFIDRDGPGDLGERGDLVEPGYERLVHGSLGAGHQVLHR